MREISAYDRMVWPVPLLEDFLREGKHARDLAAYFGTDEYERLLKLLAAIPAQLGHTGRHAALRHPMPPPAARPRVYLLPGMLGSQLGTLRSSNQPPDLLWIDPADVVAGHLSDLRLPEGAAIHSLGIIAYTYLSLKLELNRAGFDVRLWDYDWRQDIAQLGARLAADIAADPAPDIRIVGHSMGGLVARAALQVLNNSLPARVAQFIALGTPHRGSFSALQALRGSYSVVRRLAALDRLYGAEHLTSNVFGSFPALYQMLPDDVLEGVLDLSSAAEWPHEGPQPDERLLELRDAFAATLAPLDARTTCIVGVHQPTVVSAAATRAEFRYTVTLSGDGTVPLASSSLTPTCYYVTCEHGDLPRDAGVAQCCVDLLLHGRSDALPTTLVSAVTARDALVSLEIGDQELARCYPEHIDWQSLGAEERGSYFNQLNLAPAQYQRLR
jgi:pimeloyl-ACP methyl ester carboxylesterase